MKGIVFTEFLDLVESQFGYDMVDRLIEENKLTNDGAYTSVGTYPHSEMVALVTSLSQHTGVAVPELLRLYGHHVFGVFKQSYGHFFQGVEGAFQLLENIENYIHVEVRKLYPDAELPRFETKRSAPNVLEMVYHSERRMADFAQGLIEATANHFEETVSISRENVVADGSTVRFVIAKQLPEA